MVLVLATLVLSVVLIQLREADAQDARSAVCQEVGGLRDSLILILEATKEGPPDKGESKREQIEGTNELIALLQESARDGLCVDYLVPTNSLDAGGRGSG